MRVEIVKREYNRDRTALTLVNTTTRKHIATFSPHDNFFTSQRVAEAVNLYDDLHRLGLLKAVLNAVEKRSAEQDG